jgi:hypothetical protein
LTKNKATKNEKQKIQDFWGALYSSLYDKVDTHFTKKYYGTHLGGVLVYGEPWPIQSSLKLYLGKLIGWAWFITEEKK